MKTGKGNYAHSKHRKLENGFEKRLAEVIVDSNLTYYELEKRCGICNNNIYAYVKGEKSPRIYALYKLCKELGCSADYLLGLSKEK